MLKSISPFYQKTAAAYLLMAHLSTRKIKPMPTLTVLTLTVTMDDKISTDPFSGLITADHIVDQCRITENRVQIYCRGLLEIKDRSLDYTTDSEDESDSEYAWDPEDPKIPETTPKDPMEGYDLMEITVTHRTAYDFIFYTPAGLEFIAGSTYSESDIEIRLVSGLLNQVLSLPRGTRFNLGSQSYKKKNALKRPIYTARSVQHQDSIRDSTLDRFSKSICSSDEDSLGGELMRQLKDLSAGDSGNGFLRCCISTSCRKPSRNQSLLDLLALCNQTGAVSFCSC